MDRLPLLLLDEADLDIKSVRWKMFDWLGP